MCLIFRFRIKKMKFQHEPLSKCENIILEAKRVLLNEQLDRIADIALSDKVILQNTISESKLYNEDKYYEHLTVDTAITLASQELNGQTTMTSNLRFSLVPNKTIIMKKCFQKWRNIVKAKPQKSLDQLPLEKLDDFIANLKNRQQQTPPNSGKLLNHPNSLKPSECFKNRYTAQKSIIDLQRSKIEEQNKLINELKLGIIREDLLKSIENTKIDIREIFSNSSMKLLSKAPMLKAVVEEREQIMVQSQKAPKIMQKMHQRAIERARYREIILERKKLIEDARQKLLQEAIEKKKALEEEERKRNLEIINEQRKRELHLQKIRHEKRLQFEAKLSKADYFYNNLLTQQCFRKLFLHCFKAKENNTLAISYYLHKQKCWIFKAWLEYVENQYKFKYELADANFKFKTIKNAFNRLKEWKMDCIRSIQVAEDLYDFRLASNIFIHWHRWVCKQIMLDSKKSQIAINHNQRKMLFQYFYQWRSLPVVIQLEKAKEEKKRKWREKVWEVLPDYQPPQHF